MGAASGFVGRAAELALLAGLADAAALGEGGVALIGGEPGIGKTRLADEAAARAAEAGLARVRARALPDEGCPPYWLFRQVIGEVTKTFMPNDSQHAHLSFIAPGSQAQPPRLDLAEQRFAVFESVRDFLVAAAAATGLVLLFDDVHWADPPSLRLLRHLAEGVAASRLVLLITYRDTETGGRDELTAFLAALARQDTVTRIRLTGLTQEEVARQLAVVTGGEVAPELAAAIGRRSHGNPFFVGELARIIDAGPGVLPDAVRDTVGVRLHGLSPACRDVLGTAAVLGTAVDPAAVAAVTGREPAAVLAALDEAAAAGILAAGASATISSARWPGSDCRPRTGTPCTHGWPVTSGGSPRWRPRWSRTTCSSRCRSARRTRPGTGRSAPPRRRWSSWPGRTRRPSMGGRCGFLAIWFRRGDAVCCSAWPWRGSAGST
jgi:hypothetical protein